MNLYRAVLAGALAIGVSACGGGGSTLTGGSGTQTIADPASNVLTAVVEAGPATNANVNTLYVTVTVCAPGSTSNCQTIGGLAVDTGASGLRLLASAVSPTLLAALPLQPGGNGGTLVECTQYVSGYSWGPIVTADITAAGEKASSLPVQIVGDSRYASVPGACSSTGQEQDTVDAFGANGSMGVSVFAQDCGSGCVQSAAAGIYYDCSSSTQCAPTAAALSSQVPNPVTFFHGDHNGVIIELPGVAAAGAASVTGAIVFGVDTEANNASGTATVLPVDPNYGYLTTQFNGQVYSQSFLDSGSNGLYFDDANLTQCSDQANSGFYCPSGTQKLEATLLGTDQVSKSEAFYVANADELGAGNPSLVAFPTLAGTFSLSGSFDWGLPFFYGKKVYTVIENEATAVGTGPYVAF